MKIIRVITNGLICVLFSGCAVREAYVSPIGKFAEGTKELSARVDAELPVYPTNLRTDYVRSVIVAKIANQVQVSLTTTTPKLIFDSAEDFLCSTRDELLIVTSQSEYLNAVSGVLSDISSAPSDKFGDLAKSLVSGYSVGVEPPAKAVDTVCRTDFANYSETIYPRGRTESLSEAVEGAKALWDLVEKLSIGVLQQIDSAQRTKALSGFLGQKENRDRILYAVQNQSQLLNQAVTRNRHLAVSVYVGAYQELYESLNGMDITAISSCQAYIKKPVNQETALATSADFTTCFAQIWKNLDAQIAASVEAAASYDTVATASPDAAFAKLKPAIEKLGDLADGKLTNEDRILFIESIVAVVKTSKQLRDSVNNEDTKKAVKDALDKIRGAL